MVNIQAIIKQKKQQFFAAKNKYSQEENVKKAEELQQIQKERIRMEGKARLEQAKQAELSKFREAKSQAPPSKLMAFGQGLAKVMNKGKEHLKEVKQRTGGIDFGGQRNTDVGGGSKGIDFGTGTASPFNSSPKAIKKKKVPVNVFQK